MNRIIAVVIPFCAISLCAPLGVRAVTIAWSPVGNPGNANDSVDGDSATAGVQNLGAVPYSYNIGTYEVSNSQYVEFLNAKDSSGSNPLFLYNTQMSDATFGGINFTAGNLPGSKYSAISGRGDHPVNYTSWYSSVRFANWLHNGQGNGNTENGAYLLLGNQATPLNANSIVRQVGATVFLPSRDEWYKAAFYNPGTSSYFQYSTSSNTAPNLSGPSAVPNSANYNSIVGNLTDVGAYTGTTSPYGAFDMGGNVHEWEESLILIPSQSRGTRGGSWLSSSSALRSTFQGFSNTVSNGVGFRVASIPEPSSFVLAASGLAAGLLGWRRRTKRSAGVTVPGGESDDFLNPTERFTPLGP